MADDDVKTDRRSFLGMAAAAAAGGVAAPRMAVGPETPPISGSATTAAADTYQETEHIRAAYRRMRF